MITAGDRARLLADARQHQQWRSIWLNMHLGWLHWAHNDLTDTNLKARHSCPVCEPFRKTHFKKGQNQ
jgi:hypothetical protein